MEAYTRDELKWFPGMSLGRSGVEALGHTVFSLNFVLKPCECITYSKHYINKTVTWGFPGGAVVENLPANVGDTGSSPGLGRSHMPRSN